MADSDTTADATSRFLTRERNIRREKLEREAAEAEAIRKAEEEARAEAEARSKAEQDAFAAAEAERLSILKKEEKAARKKKEREARKAQEALEAKLKAQKPDILGPASLSTANATMLFYDDAEWEKTEELTERYGAVNMTAALNQLLALFLITHPTDSQMFKNMADSLVPAALQREWTAANVSEKIENEVVGVQKILDAMPGHTNVLLVATIPEVNQYLLGTYHHTDRGRSSVTKREKAIIEQVVAFGYLGIYPGWADVDAVDRYEIGELQRAHPDRIFFGRNMRDTTEDKRIVEEAIEKQVSKLLGIRPMSGFGSDKPLMSLTDGDLDGGISCLSATRLVTQFMYAFETSDKEPFYARETEEKMVWYVSTRGSQVYAETADWQFVSIFLTAGYRYEIFVPRGNGAEVPIGMYVPTQEDRDALHDKSKYVNISLTMPTFVERAHETLEQALEDTGTVLKPTRMPFVSDHVFAPKRTIVDTRFEVNDQLMNTSQDTRRTAPGRDTELVATVLANHPFYYQVVHQETRLVIAAGVYPSYFENAEDEDWARI